MTPVAPFRLAGLPSRGILGAGALRPDPRLRGPAALRARLGRARVGEHPAA